MIGRSVTCVIRHMFVDVDGVVEEGRDGGEVEEHATILVLSDWNADATMDTTPCSSIDVLLDRRVSVGEDLICLEVDRLAVVGVPVAKKLLAWVTLADRLHGFVYEVMVKLSTKNEGE